MFNEIKNKDSEYVLHSYGRVNVAIESGHGSTAIDVNGKEYIDFTSGIGVNSLGYSNEKWAKAVSDQAQKIQHISNYYISPVATKLAETLSKASGMARMFFANSGCEANECAIKVARKFGTSKNANKIITMTNSFHGRTLTTLAATGQEVFHTQFLPLTEGFLHCDIHDIDTLKSIATEDVCAIMLECIQGEGGVMPVEKEYLQAVRKLCDERNILLIIDEVQTGVARTGKLFSFENAEIKPDVLTLAKGIGGGLPIGICLVAEKLKDIFVSSDHGSTFGANPVCCAAALSVLEQVNTEEFLKEVCEKADYFKEKLLAMDGVDFVRGQGLMIGIGLKEKTAKDMLINCIDAGLLVLTAKDVVRFLPPLNISYQEIDKGLEIFKTILEQ
ncbi:MAG: acetylornithine/succinylornithine family transaminase [Clostridia bacterium]